MSEQTTHKALIATCPAPVLLLYDRAGGSMQLFSQQVVPAVRAALADDTPAAAFSTRFAEQDAYLVLDHYRVLLLADPAAVPAVGRALGQRFVLLDEAAADTHYAKAFRRRRFDTRHGLRQFIAKLQDHYDITEFAGLDWPATRLLVILEAMMLHQPEPDSGLRP